MAKSAVPVSPFAPITTHHLLTHTAGLHIGTEDALGFPGALQLLRAFPADRIRRQLNWLPARQARNPAAMLLRAVEQDWGPPREEVA